MHYAAENDAIEIMEVLIANNSKTDNRSSNERTPLHIACLRGNVDAAHFLLEKGADPNP